MYGVDDTKYTLVQADYVQAEAVVVAYLSGDQVLMRLFEESYGMSSEEKKAKGYDIHRLTASMMFNVPIEQVTKQMRDIGKRLRHAVSYSAGPNVVAVNIGITEAEAKALLNKYHLTYPMLRLWQKRVTDQLAKDMTLTNLWGRKHRFFDRWGDSLFRSAYSFIPQSSVGDLLNLAMTDFYNQYCCDKDISLYLQLHDAMYVQCPEERVNEVMGKMRKCMAIPVPYEHGEFLIDIDFKVGKSWGALDETEYVEETIAELD
jgi:DNA polymerase-1